MKNYLQFLPTPGRKKIKFVNLTQSTENLETAKHLLSPDSERPWLKLYRYVVFQLHGTTLIRKTSNSQETRFPSIKRLKNTLSNPCQMILTVAGQIALTVTLTVSPYEY